jgi:hypothetical protein
MPPPGFTMLDNDAVIARLPEIDGSTFKVYVILARRADAAGYCYPSIKSIAADAGLKPRTVQNAIYRAIELGLAVAGRQKGRVTVYRLTHATRCASTKTGGASDCATPTQQDALGDATRCATPTQPGAHGTRPKNNTHKQHPRTKTQVRGTAAAGVVEIPAELTSDAFQAAWQEWLQHRTEIKKPVKPTAQTAKLRELAAWGPERARAAIRHSIGNGWQGIFEPGANGANGNGKSRTIVIGPGQRHAADCHTQEGVL